MPKKMKKETKDENMVILDSYESWLQKQPPRIIKAKAGFNRTKEIE